MCRVIKSRMECVLNWGMRERERRCPECVSCRTRKRFCYGWELVQTASPCRPAPAGLSPRTGRLRGFNGSSSRTSTTGTENSPWRSTRTASENYMRFYGGLYARIASENYVRFYGGLYEQRTQIKEAWQYSWS